MLRALQTSGVISSKPGPLDTWSAPGAAGTSRKGLSGGAPGTSVGPPGMATSVSATAP